MAVFLTIGIIQLILMPEASWFNLVLLFFQQMLIGGVVGYLFGRLLLYLINRLRLGYEGLYPVLALGMLLLTFAIAALLRGSGFLAVYVVGLVLGKSDFLHKRSLSRFYEGLAWLSQIIMFLTLGLLVFPSRLLPVALSGMLIAAILILVARPISVWISLLPFRFAPNEKNFISWVGLRGAVPIILATYPRLAGLDQTGIIFNVVFFVILSSVLIQGTTITRAARLLRVDDPADSDATSYPLEISPWAAWRGVLQEVIVRDHAGAVGKAIFELHLPKDYLIVLIARQDEFLIPNGSIVLESNDRILGLARPETHNLVAGMLANHKQPDPSG